MVGIWQDIRHGGRSLLKSPGLTVVVILILTVGIGANAAMFSVIDVALIRPLPYPEAERLVLARTTYEGWVRNWVSARDYWDYRDLSTSFEQLAAFSGFSRDVTVTGVEEPERLAALVVSRELLPALRARPLIGRSFAADDELETAPRVAILSYGYWQRLGGTPDLVGRVLTIDGLATEVVGVMPAGFRFRYDVEIWLPMRADDRFIAERGKTNWSMVGRLAPGVPIAQAQSEADVIAGQLAAQYPESNRGVGLDLTSLQEAWSENYREGLFLLQAAVALVLLVACGNVAGLLLARGSTRRGELALRGALGASGSRIARQLFTESLLLAGAAGLLGVIVAEWLKPLLLQLTVAGEFAVRESGTSLTVLVFVLVVSGLTGLVFGTLPAQRASRCDLAQDLKSNVRTTDRGGARFRSGLVVAQVAVSVVLLVGAGLLIRSLATLMSEDLGFAPGKLITAEVRLPRDKYRESERRVQVYTELVQRLRAIPGVEGVGLISQLPIRQPGNNEPVHDAADPPIELIDARTAYFRAVLPGYFEAMGIPLLAGRDIEATDHAGSPLVFVVNQAFADSILRGRDPIGRRVVFDYEYTFEVVGVVGDVTMSGLGAQRFPAMYGSYAQIPHFDMGLAVRTFVEPESMTGALRGAVWSVEPDIPDPELITMDAVLSDSQVGRSVRTVALAIFAGVAVLLAVVGLYGVLAQSVVERRREIGVRVALGARPSDITEMVLRRGLALVAGGIGIGLVAALASSRLLEQMLFRIEPTDPATFVLVSVLFSAVAVVACLLPAWRALRVDPVTVLQTE
ncbi:MAG: ABC transporter permease [Gemmatimonadota bacterium]|nr:MAG: ABC transporter permease [Gemmatimonadota bacterium]